MRSIILVAVCVLICVVKDSQQQACIDCNVGGVQGSFVGGRPVQGGGGQQQGGAQLIQAYLHPDGSISYNGNNYIPRQRPGGQNYPQNNRPVGNQGGGNGGCVCQGNTCSNCAIG